jgi:hypothetical protein
MKGFALLTSSIHAMSVSAVGAALAVSEALTGTVAALPPKPKALPVKFT